MFSWTILALLPGLIAYPIILYSVGDERVADKGTWVDYPIYIFRALVFSVSWPLLGLVWIIIQFEKRIEQRNSAFHKRKDLIIGKSYDDGKLRFLKMGGSGLFYCNDCFYKQTLVSSKHGFGEPPWTKSGYQCQECGRLHEIECDYKLDSIPECECGGNLSRENPLFCPACKSYKVSYFMTKIS